MTPPPLYFSLSNLRPEFRGAHRNKLSVLPPDRDPPVGHMDGENRDDFISLGDCINPFDEITGLEANLGKDTVFFAGVEDRDKES
ncbi:hypothetical protein ACH5RR_009414 [Cinchona calisaya]|uniref:Uncharacterized protein n=1 Tax=Cinchona calisaya TaxID=153742 RepID=A0ABD3AH17_9GENT